jgi:hypothetical protein
MKTFNEYKNEIYPNNDKSISNLEKLLQKLIDNDLVNSFETGASVVKLTNLPTSDPHVVGQLWVDTANGNVIKVSQG